MLRFSVLLLLLYAFHAQGQKRLQYDSLYHPLPGYFGKACFSYYLDKSEQQPIKDGDFSFTSTHQDSSCATEILYREWVGAYRKDKKEGKWTYQSRTHHAAISAMDYTEMEYALSTRLEELEAHYDKGVPAGSWYYSIRNLKGDRLVSEPEEGKVVFDGGLAAGKVYYIKRLEHEEHTDTLALITGESQDGLMEGEWQLIYQEEGTTYQEIRKYERGVLRSLMRIENTDTFRLNFPIAPELATAMKRKGKAISIVDRPLNLTFNDGYPRTSIYITSQKPGNRLLGQVMEEFMHFDPDFIAQNGLVLGTNRGYYPLSSEEKKGMKNWHRHKKAFIDTLNTLRQKSLEHFQYRADSALQTISGWWKYQQGILDYVAPWEEVFYKDEMAFYYRGGLLVEYADSLLRSDRILNGADTIVFDYPRDSTDDFILYIASNMESRRAMADSLSRLFDQRLEDIRLREAILAKKLEIDAYKLRLDSLYRPPFKKKHPVEAVNTLAKGLERVRRTTKERFLDSLFAHRYNMFVNAEDDPLRQQQLIGLLQFDLENLEASHTLMQQFFERLAPLDSAYTDYSFDPFTYTDKVPERLKRPLYEAATGELMPAMLQEAQQQDTPLATREVLQRLLDLQKRLFFLSDKETKSLERKIRRSDEPAEQLLLINNF